MNPSVSVIIPVYNEAGVINGTVRHIRSMPQGRDAEIIVADGHPEETSLAVIDDPAVIRIGSVKGRGCQMNAGARKASGAILLFLHADTRLPLGGLNRVISVMACDSGCVGGAFCLRIDNRRGIFRLIEAATNRRARLTRVPYGDQAIFVRRDYFHEAGGYREIPLLEDVDFMRRVRRRGDRIVLLPEAVETSSRRWDRDGILFTTLRNRVIMILYYLGVSPGRLARLYM